MNESIKRVSPAILVVTVLVGVGVIIGALIFADDGPEFWDKSDSKNTAQAVTQPMELRGDWLGLSLVDLTSPSARRANIPAGTKGVMVAEISETMGWRARQAGLMPRDEILSINKQNIRDINDLYDVTRKVNIADAIFLSASRWGQPMMVVLPALYAPAASPMAPGAPGQPMMAGQPGMQQPGMMPQQPWQQQQPGMMPQQAGIQQGWQQPQPMMPQQVAMPQQGWQQPQQNVAWQQPPQQNVAWQQQPMQQVAMPAAQAAAGQQTGPLWVCPRHGLGWHQHLVAPNFRCPLCNGPLRMAQ
jgi:hypothetical protein